eukprot:CAMPEP_0119018224 /NCGR_PEP_ID=MMETSP1176-20130426/18864_1 /TAXON_ID=265551 /ORGANISM="Synedropsis recta cf, Strain CCMP1620" /LENGTH=188 /DNA_ID=CAMNT_0006972177 /DNA_START=343 /DNA_END=909 /DNA_ORIENTATION=+
MAPIEGMGLTVMRAAPSKPHYITEPPGENGVKEAKAGPPKTKKLVDDGDQRVLHKVSPPRGYILLQSRSPSPNLSKLTDQLTVDQPVPVDQHVDQSGTYEPLPEIEVSPGVFMELRGAKETSDAIDAGVAARVQCFCCAGTLECVPDAQMVICQDCRVVSLVEDSACNGLWRKENRRERRGVGLGLKM